MTAPAPGPLSALAAELARLVAASPGKRVQVADLFDAAARYEASLLGDPAARGRFRDALGELEAAVLVTLPAVRSRTGWDRRIHPALPSWVLRVDPAPTEPGPQSPTRVWPSALERAAATATRPDEYRLLDRIATWLRDNPAPVPVPAQERSVELFDDEKALDGYLKTRLFTSGTLTLDLLGCFPPPVPFVSQHVPGQGPTGLLVVENLATYTSFLTALRERDTRSRPDLHVGWGVGNSFTQSILGMPLLDPAPQQARYFGDLDLAGLTIAVNAAAQAAAAGLPELRPAASCYQFLLDGPDHWRRPDGSSRADHPDYIPALHWLAPAQRPQAEALLTTRCRIPQERLGLQVIRSKLVDNRHADLVLEIQAKRGL